MSTKATAARIYEYGEPDVFRFETMDVPDPVGHEVVVRNTVIGLNFVDFYYRRGTLPVPEFPAIIGDEASGVVEAVGPNVTLVKVGDRVAYADAFGAYTTVRLYPEDRLTLIPDGVTDDQAASSLLKGLTARYLLKETVQLHEGDTVLYHAAAGGVGQIFTQWARSFGIHVIGTVSTADKAQIALQAGCTAVVNYSTEDFVERTFELTGGQGVKAVYDSVGKDTFRGSLAVLRPRGTLVQSRLHSEEAHSPRRCSSDRNARIQLLHPWSLEERDRLGLSAPWGERLVWESSGDHGCVSRRNRNWSCPGSVEGSPLSSQLVYPESA